jgi:hypothetical protein
MRKNLLENISPEIRRRLGNLKFEKIKNELFVYRFEPCDYEDVGEWVGDVCDFLKNTVIERIELDDIEVTPKEKDTLYYYFVDTYGKLLVDYYKQECNKGLKESKNKIIVTESQYKRLFKQKKTKINVFQALIDNILTYIRNFCDKSLDGDDYSGDVGFGSCDVIDMIESIKIDKIDLLQSGNSNLSNEVLNISTFIHITITINYSNIRYNNDFDDIIYDIKHILTKKVGTPIIFSYDINRINTNDQW